jgi:hypothetical protein
MRFPSPLGVRGRSLLILATTAVLATGSLALVSYESSRNLVRHVVAEDPSRNALLQLRICGMGPEEFAAAGVNGEQLQAVTNAAAAYIHDYGDFSAPLAARQAANGQYDVLRRQVESGTATQEQKSAFDAAISAKTTAAAAFESNKSVFVNAAIAALPVNTRQQLTVLATNHDVHVPAEFKVQERDEAYWLTLRNACAAERIALRKQQQVPADAAAILADARATPAVATAKASLDANLATLKGVFDPQTAQPPVP